jgi:hypothetical protein
VKKGQQISAHLRYGLIFATLPGKNPDKFTTQILQATVQDGIDTHCLVLVQRDLDHDRREQAD